MIHTYLAWQDESGYPLGRAITRQALRPQTEIAIRFAHWLTRLFECIFHCLLRAACWNMSMYCGWPPGKTMLSLKGSVRSRPSPGPSTTLTAGSPFASGLATRGLSVNGLRFFTSPWLLST